LTRPRTARVPARSSAPLVRPPVGSDPPSRSAAPALIAVVAAALVVFAPPSTAGSFPKHTNITATVFWIGEPVGNGSSENNALSAWDDAWQAHYGGFDDYGYLRRAPFFPRFEPHENPFYLDLPYNDFTESGAARLDRTRVVPWATKYLAELSSGRPFSLLKNRWVKLWRTVGGRTAACYGQIEDSGPYLYDDAAYVFGSNDRRPRSGKANNAGMDVSPALRDCLHFSGLNNDSNRLSWQFVEARQVPRGPWRLVVTTRQVFWR
jgi:hypothetical protein